MKNKKELADIENLKKTFNSLEKLQDHGYNTIIQKEWDDAVNNKSVYSHHKTYNTIDFLKSLIEEKTGVLARETHPKRERKKMPMKEITPTVLQIITEEEPEDIKKNLSSEVDKQDLENPPLRRQNQYNFRKNPEQTSNYTGMTTFRKNPEQTSNYTGMTTLTEKVEQGKKQKLRRNTPQKLSSKAEALRKSSAAAVHNKQR